VVGVLRSFHACHIFRGPLRSHMRGTLGAIGILYPFPGHGMAYEPEQLLLAQPSRFDGRKNSPISSPNPDSKPTNSRTRLSTLNHREKHGDRKRPDKPVICPSRRNKPEQRPDRNTPQKKFRQIAQKLKSSKAPAT